MFSDDTQVRFIEEMPSVFFVLFRINRNHTRSASYGVHLTRWTANQNPFLGSVDSCGDALVNLCCSELPVISKLRIPSLGIRVLRLVRISAIQLLSVQFTAQMIVV